MSRGQSLCIGSLGFREHEPVQNDTYINQIAKSACRASFRYAPNQVSKLTIELRYPYAQDAFTQSYFPISRRQTNPLHFQTENRNSVKYSQSAEPESCSFVLSDGSRLVALWNDTIASNYHPGIPTTVTLEGVSPDIVTGIDSLTDFNSPFSRTANTVIWLSQIY